MSTVEQLYQKQSKLLNQLEYLPKLELPLLLKECYYGALSGQLSSSSSDAGYLIDNFRLNAWVPDNDKVEYKISIQNPNDWKQRLIIRHELWRGYGKSSTQFSERKYGKWDKHLDVAIEKIRAIQIQYVKNKLEQVKIEIDSALYAVKKEKELFESFFD